MPTDWVTRAEYDREMAALKAEIDTLKAIVSSMQKSGLSNRVANLEFMQQPLGAIGVPLPPEPRDNGPH